MAKWVDKYGPGYEVLVAGDIELSIHASPKVYKDGTRLYSIWLKVNGAHSKEIITVTKVRGYEVDAKAAAEAFIRKVMED